MTRDAHYNLYHSKGGGKALQSFPDNSHANIAEKSAQPMSNHWKAISTFCIQDPAVAVSSPPEYNLLSMHLETLQAALREQAARSLAQMHALEANDALRPLIFQTLIATLLCQRKLPVLLRDELLHNLVREGRTGVENSDTVHSCMNILKLVDPESEDHINMFRSRIPPRETNRKRKNKKHQKI